MKLRCDSHKPGIKQFMEVGSQQQSILHLVWPLVAVATDMRRF